MRRGFYLFTCGAVAALLVVGIGRSDPPPDCKDCPCHEAEAWHKLTGGKVGDPEVLKVPDKDFPKGNKWGPVKTNAHWYVTASPRVYDSACLKNNHEDITGTDDIRVLTYTDSWPVSCALGPSHTHDGWRPVTYDPNSPNHGIGTSHKRYSCGKQD